jgi:hypothetical protein
MRFKFYNKCPQFFLALTLDSIESFIVVLMEEATSAPAARKWLELARAHCTSARGRPLYFGEGAPPPTRQHTTVGARRQRHPRKRSTATSPGNGEIRAPSRYGQGRQARDVAGVGGLAGVCARKPRLTGAGKLTRARVHPCL